MKPGGVHRYVPQIATIKHTSLCDLLNTHQATRHTTQRTFHRTHVATQQLRWHPTSFLMVKVWRDEFLDLDDGWPSKLNSNKPVKNKKKKTPSEICLTLLVVCHWTDTQTRPHEADSEQQQGKSSQTRSHGGKGRQHFWETKDTPGETFLVPTFWPDRHLLVCSQGHSSGERSGKHSYWLRRWWERQCLEEGEKNPPNRHW